MKKLIRDKIPEIMILQNKKPIIEICKNNNEFYEYLKQKLNEEVGEFINTDKKQEQIEGMADIFEVINNICEFNKISKSEIENIRIKKFKERGGFEKRIILVV
ncbi:MAG: nucleoside triphosphate pyrophosphohydrolase [Rickettsiales bacterium]|jgi:predicted house-cleaning noncanonical NTP pyrophosphatase (MazG superfamily)|nr:nucleoside triphosphate pyrophosphohydrolase [Rickettsiales bacterium]